MALSGIQRCVSQGIAFPPASCHFCPSRYAPTDGLRCSCWAVAQLARQTSAAAVVRCFVTTTSRYGWRAGARVGLRQCGRLCDRLPGRLVCSPYSAPR